MPYINENSSARCSDDPIRGTDITENEDERSQFMSSLDEFDADDDDDDNDLESDGDTDDFYMSDYITDETDEIVRASVFFEKIESVLPDIEEISSDESKLRESEMEQPEDDDEFVDPLTGENLHHAPEKVEVTAEEIQEELPVEEESEEESDESEESELISDSELTFPDEIEEVVTAAKEEDEETFGAFLEMETVKEVTLDEQIDIDTITLEREQERERQGVIEFLEKIITHAVVKAEFASTDVQLRKKVDKRLLMEALIVTCTEYIDARDERNFLERKCIEYYKRKRSYREITADNPKTYDEDRMKFYQSVASLDEWLKKEIGAAEKHAETVRTLEQELQNLKEDTVKEVADFEVLLKKTLQLDHRPNLNKIMESMFRYMGQLRREINETRFKLIILQHTKVDLIQELSTYNNFNHVNIKDLENMCISLNHDLKKLRVRCRTNIHTMAHYMEKQKMLSDAVHNQKLALEDLHDERLSLRKRIFRLKIQRTQIRTGINTINFLNSLIDKPTLMLDYDQTMQATITNDEVLYNLRNQKRQLEEDISKLIKKCFE